MNPYSSSIERSIEHDISTVENVDVSVSIRDRNVIRYADVVTVTFAIVMFGLAIPLNAYVMLKYATAFNFKNPVLVTAVRWLFPWLTMLLAIGIPALVYFNRTKRSGRSKTLATLLLLSATVILGVLVFIIVSMPIVTWLNAM